MKWTQIEQAWQAMTRRVRPAYRSDAKPAPDLPRHANDMPGASAGWSAPKKPSAGMTP